MPTPAGQSVAEIVARFLVARGVDRIYGLQGGHIQPIWDHLHRLGAGRKMRVERRQQVERDDRVRIDDHHRVWRLRRCEEVIERVL